MAADTAAAAAAVTATAAEAAAATAVEAVVEGEADASAPPAPSRPAPPKGAYHPNVICRGGDGCTCVKGRMGPWGEYEPDWPHPVIVDPMYLMPGGVCVCEGAASKEEKKYPVKRYPGAAEGPLVRGFDLRGWDVADIQGLRGADGTLDLKGAILCGARLGEAQLHGAMLSEAQLQGAVLAGAKLQEANLMWAQLQGARLGGVQLQGAWLCKAQLQAADLGRAQLQGTDFSGAQLEGANLEGAQLQGAYLTAAHLQGADLSRADLSVLPRGFLATKLGSPGETEVTKVDRPTTLRGANLSVLPKGSKYTDNGGPILGEVTVSAAARPSNLTGAKASGADFGRANLSEANFTGATLDQHTTINDAIFSSFLPPERPASGALALVTAVARATLAAADVDNDSGSDDGKSGEEEEEDEEEESPAEIKVEEFLDAFMRRLRTALYQGTAPFLIKVEQILNEVEEQLKTSLLKSGVQGATDANSILADLLCEDLKKAPDGKQAAVISKTLFEHVVSPLFEQHLPQVLDTVLSELLQQTKAGAAELLQSRACGSGITEASAAVEQKLLQGLQKQLLEAFKQRALGAGKATLVKRLTLIVSKLAETGFSFPEDPACMGRAVLRPEESLVSSAACLVQELWKTLRASLGAQARSPSAHTAAAFLITPPAQVTSCILVAGKRRHCLLR